jgi:hypothetical protein
VPSPKPPSRATERPLVSLDDAVWLKVSDARRNLVSSGVLFFRGELDRDLLHERVRATFPSYPKLVARPERSDGSWRWHPLPDFDVLDNVEVRACSDLVRADAGRLVLGPRLAAELEALVGEDLSAERPRWRLVVVEGLRYADEPAFCMVLTTHHCVADGVAYYDILANLCQHPDRGMHHVRRAPPARASWLRSLWANVCYLAGTLRPEPASFLSEGAPAGQWLAISAPVALPTLAAYAKRHRVTINALAMAALARAIVAQVRASGGRPLRRLRAVLPVSAHTRDDATSELVNRMGYFHVHFDLRRPDVAGLARAIDAEMRGFKTYGIDTMMQNVARLIAVLPTVLARPLHRFFCSRASLVVSCFPFPSTPLSLGAAQAVNIGAFPVVPHPMGTSTMIVTHGGHLTLYARSILRTEGATGLVEHFGAELAALGQPAEIPSATPTAAAPSAA